MIDTGISCRISWRRRLFAAAAVAAAPVVASWRIAGSFCAPAKVVHAPVKSGLLLFSSVRFGPVELGSVSWE